MPNWCREKRMNGKDIYGPINKTKTKKGLLCVRVFPNVTIILAIFEVGLRMDVCSTVYHPLI